MSYFNPNVTIEDVLKDFNWDQRLSDLIIFKSNLYPISIEQGLNDKIKLFEEEYNSSFPSKKSELLFSTIRDQKRSLSRFSEALEPLKDEEYVLLDEYKDLNLSHQFYKLYKNGDNFHLKTLKSYIVPVIEAELNYCIGMYNLGSTSDHEYTIQEMEVEIEQIFHYSLYSALKLVVETVDFLKYLLEKCKELDEGSEIISDLNKKLIWKGKPADFAFIIDLLINKGYLEKPTKFGTRNARILLQYFDFIDDNPTGNSLGNMLHKDFDPIKNASHKAKFLAIPRRDELDK